MSTSDSGLFLAPLPGLAVLRLQGPDAITFLHAQLSHDIAAITPERALLNAYCTARGRLLATLVVWPDATQPDTLYALVSADIAESLVKKLTMFVFRSKVKINLTDRQVAGLAFKADTQSALALQSVGLATSTLSVGTTWQVSQTSEATFIQAPSSDDNPRWWLIHDEVLSFPATDATNEACWQTQDIAAGLPWITASTQELFTAQALNLDLIDAVSFTKGCYPGQEVIARSHYRGTVKRRMVYATAEVSSDTIATTELPGSDIFDHLKPDTPCGRIINASHDGQQLYLLLEITLTDQDTADFRLQSSDGPSLSLQALPYPLQAEA